ncbi:uncharacterized protein LOC117342993 [Pecten maximus]|uniref:uncharacterized protein LOC117342993 n=1 Tax=Pecten maximus TaxID=6579 RepID=UPI001458110E|nr:uncharacterized protein LOC117342993 [Pecten maximus]
MGISIYATFVLESYPSGCVQWSPTTRMSSPPNKFAFQHVISGRYICPITSPSGKDGRSQVVLGTREDLDAETHFTWERCSDDCGYYRHCQSNQVMHVNYGSVPAVVILQADRTTAGTFQTPEETRVFCCQEQGRYLSLLERPNGSVIVLSDGNGGRNRFTRVNIS